MAIGFVAIIVVVGLVFVVAFLLGFLLGRASGPHLGSVAQPPYAPPPGMPVDGLLEAEAAGLLQQGRKIEAIKLVRERTGLGLAEAKAWVERLG